MYVVCLITTYSAFLLFMWMPKANYNKTSSKRQLKQFLKILTQKKALNVYKTITGEQEQSSKLS